MAQQWRAPAEQAQRATYTTDGDLAIDPDLLSDDPDTGQALIDAGYQRGPNPGVLFARNGVEIDFMAPMGLSQHPVVEASSFQGEAASPRRAPGLELALLDADPLHIAAREEADGRVIELRVAGAAALTVAKLIKLEERLAGSRCDRIISKDTGDLLRLFRYCDAETIGHRLSQLTSNEPVAPVVERATAFLRTDISRTASNLIALAVADRAVNEAERQVAAAMNELSRRLLSAYDGGQ